MLMLGTIAACITLAPSLQDLLKKVIFNCKQIFKIVKIKEECNQN